MLAFFDNTAELIRRSSFAGRGTFSGNQAISCRGDRCRRQKQDFSAHVYQAQPAEIVPDKTSYIEDRLKSSHENKWLIDAAVGIRGTMLSADTKKACCRKMA